MSPCSHSHKERGSKLFQGVLQYDVLLDSKQATAHFKLVPLRVETGQYPKTHERFANKSKERACWPTSTKY